MSDFIDFDAQFFIDSILLIIALGILCMVISIPVLTIILLLKAIKNQDLQSKKLQDYQNEK